MLAASLSFARMPGLEAPATAALTVLGTALMLKKMKAEDREIAMRPTQFRGIGSNQFIDLRDLDETDEKVYHSVYYKEIPLVTGNLDETLVVTYSPKYKAYQRRIRARQIERAKQILASSD